MSVRPKVNLAAIAGVGALSVPPLQRSADSPAHPESLLAAVVEVVLSSPLFLCKYRCCFPSPPSPPQPSSAKACISPHSHLLHSIIPPATPPITPQLFQRITGGMI
ncbi:unnamed protein product [Closterium sp. NIES-64]|nr:unnamed protein product [Closterium sp. NIES-64]